MSTVDWPRPVGTKPMHLPCSESTSSQLLVQLQLKLRYTIVITIT